MSVGCDRFAEAQLGNQAACVENAGEAFPQADVVDVGGRSAVAAVRRAVAQGCRHHRAMQRNRGLQQRRQEAPQAAPVAGRAFRKYGNPVAALHQGGHVGVDAFRVGTAAAFEEQRTHTVREPADHRPLPYLRFRHEAHAARGQDQVDVDPGHVVAQQQGAGGQGGRRLDAQAYAQDRQQTRRPAGDDAVARGFAGQRQGNERQRDP